MDLRRAYGDYLLKTLPLFQFTLYRGELFLNLSLQSLQNVSFFLKNHSHAQYKILTDIIGIDYPQRKNRFEVIYNFLSILFNCRLFLKLVTNEVEPFPSLVSIYRNASWFEREVWDMFGIFFYGHNDLRRILTDYGFEGFPLRKDFPLSGYVELQYSELRKRVATFPVTLSQELRAPLYEGQEGKRVFF